jgi:hypothetical protein
MRHIRSHLTFANVAFRVNYGKGKHHRRSMRRCVRQEIRGT